MFNLGLNLIVDQEEMLNSWKFSILLVSELRVGRTTFKKIGGTFDQKIDQIPESDDDKY